MAYLRGRGDQAAVEGTGPVGPREVLRYAEANHLDVKRSGIFDPKKVELKGGLNIQKFVICGGARFSCCIHSVYTYTYLYIYIYTYIYM